MNKKFLSKLMQLDSKRADEYLANFADEVSANVMSEKADNDHIIESLNVPSATPTLNVSRIVFTM